MRPFEIPTRVIERVRTNVTATESGCLISNYSTGSHGYAQIGWNEGDFRTVTVAHRVAWIGEHGPIPDGLTVDHLCKQRKCVNIAHLRLLTNYENARRTHGRDWPLGQCANGHPSLSPARCCAICSRRQKNESQRRRRAARRLEAGVN